MRSILIVEDNEVIIKGLTYLLEKENQVDFQSENVSYVYYQEKDNALFLIVTLCSQEQLLS